jgi:putative ABC transport system ATP-binding protein
MSGVALSPAQVPAARTAVGVAGAALRLRGVRRAFAGGLAPARALRGVDLVVGDGEFVAVLGPSGCGKSTLLGVAAGLEGVDEGSVEVAGQRVDGRDEDWLARFRRHHVGVVFQFFTLLEGMSALDNIAVPAVIGGMRPRAAESRARDLLDLLGIAEAAPKAPAALSGGQRQRLAVARALVNEPSVVLADEPTAALDGEGGSEVLELFRRLRAEGRTVVVATHSAQVAAAADRVVHMHDGRVVGPGFPA